MDPIILFIQFDELSDDTKSIIATFMVMSLICLIMLIIYMLLLITNLIYNLSKTEKKNNLEYSYLNDH